jgi:hypothetical protein
VSRCRNAVVLGTEDLPGRRWQVRRVHERGRAPVDVRHSIGLRSGELRAGRTALRDPQPVARDGEVGRRRAGRERAQPLPARVHLGDRLAVGVEDPRAAVGGGNGRGRALERRGRGALPVSGDAQQPVGDGRRDLPRIAARADRDHDRGRDDDRGPSGHEPAAAMTAVRRRAPPAERRVLAHDRLVEGAQPLPRFDPELLGQRAPARLVDVERLRLATRAIQREHQLPACALAQRLARDQVAQRSDRVGIVAQGELGLEPLLLHRHAQLAQRRERLQCERCVDEVRERIAAPQRGGLLEHRGGTGGVAVGEPAPRLLERALAAGGVDRLRGDIEEVAGCAREDRVLAQHATKLRDVSLQRRRRGLRRLLPHTLDQLAGRNDRARLEREHCQHRSAARAAEWERLAVRGCLERAQQTEVELAAQGAILRRHARLERALAVR